MKILGRPVMAYICIDFSLEDNRTDLPLSHQRKPTPNPFPRF